MLDVGCWITIILKNYYAEVPYRSLFNEEMNLRRLMTAFCRKADECCLGYYCFCDLARLFFTSQSVKTVPPF
jgi:hypothetical protein